MRSSNKAASATPSIPPTPPPAKEVSLSTTTSQELRHIVYEDDTKLPYDALHKFCIVLYRENKRNEHKFSELQCKVNWLGQRVRALDTENFALKDSVSKQMKCNECEIQLSPESPQP